MIEIISLSLIGVLGILGWFSFTYHHQGMQNHDSLVNHVKHLDSQIKHLFQRYEDLREHTASRGHIFRLEESLKENKKHTNELDTLVIRLSLLMPMVEKLEREHLIRIATLHLADLKKGLK